MEEDLNRQAQKPDEYGYSGIYTADAVKTIDAELTPFPEIDDKSDFTKGSVANAILRLTIPLTLAQVINVTYSVVNRIYLGHMPGAEILALTGVSLSMPIIQIMMSVAQLCGTGGGPLFAIARGKRDDAEAERLMGNSFALLIILGVLMTAAVVIFKKPILYLFGASDNTYPYAAEYLTVYSFGTIFVMIGLGMNPFINAQGFGKIGMLTIALGAVINVSLDPIFIFVLGMGVRGAALGTVIAQFCSALWVLLFLTGKRTKLRLKLQCFRLQAKRVRKILTLGVAGFIMNVTTSLTQIVCNVVLQGYGGDLYVGVMAVINALREVVFMPVSGIYNGMVPVIGYNFGAGAFERVRKAIKFSVSVTVVYSVIVWAIIILLPGALIRIFNTETELIAIGVPALRMYFMLFIFMSLQMSSQGVFIGLGRSKSAIFFSLLRKAIIAAPLTVLLPYLGMGTNGVFVAEAISQFTGGLICFTTMYIVVYRKLLKTREENGVLNVPL